MDSTSSTFAPGQYCTSIAGCRNFRLLSSIYFIAIILMLWVGYKHISKGLVTKLFHNKDSLGSLSLFDEDSEDMTILKMYLENRKQDMLHMQPPSFLPEFKNPCFYEDLVNDGEQHGKRLRCLPYFLVIGIGKCGTTNVFNSILNHPDVIEPPQKELSYWPNCRHCEKNKKPTSWSEYLDTFNRTASRLIRRASRLKSNAYSGKDGIPQFVTGEGSPGQMHRHAWWNLFSNYLKDGQLPPISNAHYIKYFLPNVKMIITLRDPTERMYSDYSRTCRRNDIEESPSQFHQIVLDEIKEFKRCRNFYTIRFCTYKHAGLYLHRGIFVVFIRDWFKVFPRSQFYISQVEYYAKHKVEVMEEIYRFLELRDVKVEQKLEYKPKPAKTMNEKTRLVLKQFYKPFNIDLADLLNDERFAWDS